MMTLRPPSVNQMRLDFLTRCEAALSREPSPIDISAPVTIGSAVYHVVYDGMTDRLILQPDDEFRRIYETARRSAVSEGDIRRPIPKLAEHRFGWMEF